METTNLPSSESHRSFYVLYIKAEIDCNFRYERNSDSPVCSVSSFSSNVLKGLIVD